jgi:nicotinate-nucleotide pyrophosphorylase (carboxylating)
VSLVPSTAPAFPLDEHALDHLVHAALSEDRAFEDLTSIATILSDRRARARLVARADGVICGVPLAQRAFALLSDRTMLRVEAPDGTRVRAGDVVLHLSGHARALLGAERVALNFLQHLSGIASLTRRYVDAVEGSGARILDTRKTLPGWRALAKYAVACGGGVNHRMDLAAAILIKDNHLAACDGDVALAVQRCRQLAPPGTVVQVECDTAAQLEAAIAAGVEMVLLDNFAPDALRDAAARARAAGVISEASGGITLHTVREVAACGVDRISVGALTHSAPALDLALDFD